MHAFIIPEIVQTLATIEIKLSGENLKHLITQLTHNYLSVQLCRLMLYYLMRKMADKMRQWRFPFMLLAKQLYLLVPTPQNTPTKLPLQKEVKSLEFTRALQDPFKRNTYFAVEY